MPGGFFLWLLFVLWACFAAVEVQGSLRLVGFAVRLSTYFGATLVFLYIFNARTTLLPTRRILLGLAFFFAFVVLGGYLGVLMPRVTLSTPAAQLLPGSIAQNEYVNALVNPSFAEVQQPYGSPRTFFRPSAPFPYTNGWGCNVALLVPIMIATISMSGRGRLHCPHRDSGRCHRAGVRDSESWHVLGDRLRPRLCLDPTRDAWKDRAFPRDCRLHLVGIAFAAATGVTASLSERLHYSQTNVGRQTIYREAFDGAVASPVFGNGSPKPSQTLDISIGTQGQVWNLMFSYGFPALFFFVAWFVVAAWSSRRLPTLSGLFLHVALVVVLLTLFYYGYDGMQLAVAMAAAGVALRGAPGDARAVEGLPAVARTDSMLL